MAATKSGLVVSYYSPNPNDPDTPLLYLSTFDFEGHLQAKEPLLVDDVFIGVLKNSILTVKGGEDMNDTFRYFDYAD